MEKQELGLSGTFGSFALADDEDERDLHLLLERYFTGLEKRKLIEGPFIR